MKNLVLLLISILFSISIQSMASTNLEDAKWSYDEGTEIMVIYSTAVDEGACMGAYSNCVRRIW